MHKGGWKPFWAALGAALLVLLPLVGGTVLLTRQMLRQQWLMQTAEPQRGVPIDLPKADDRMTLLLCTAGEQPGFVLFYLNAPQNAAHLLAVPGQLTVPFGGGEASLAQCYAAAGPARCRQALLETLALPEDTLYLALSPAVLETLAARYGAVRVSLSGALTAEELDKKITSKTKLVAIGMVSNVLGLRAPVEEIVARAHAVGAVVVLDCAQSAPHMPVDVKKLDVDFAACSAHKLYAPMGMGALYARKELLDKMPPFLSGGDMIGAVHEHTATWAEGPRKFEAGTRNVGGEVGFAAALDYMDAIGWDAMMAHEHALLERMLKGMASMPWLTVYGEPVADKRFGVVSFNVQDVHPHDVATILDAGGVAIRAGHHCAQPLMDFLGIGSCCRASLALYNTEEDVDALLNNLENVRKVMGL